jgi:hypothetical protein
MEKLRLKKHGVKGKGRKAQGTGHKAQGEKVKVKVEGSLPRL